MRECQPHLNESSTAAESLDAATDDRPATPSRAANWSARLIICLLSLLVLGPLASTWLPVEISRWYQAAAYEQRLVGDFAAAYALLEQALAWAPQDSTIFQLRGDWKQAQADYVGSLEDFNRALELEPDDPHVLVQRSQTLQHLGRHQQAIADWRKLVELCSEASPGTRADVLNALAYSQALGQEDLDEALQTIETAMPLIKTNAGMLDTRGYLHLLRGNLTAAEADLDTAVALMEKELQDESADAKVKDAIDLREFELALRQRRQACAVIRYHRALLHDRGGRPAAAAADRERVRELGFEPNEQLF